MEIIARPHCSAIANNSSDRIIVPSSRIISQHRPHSGSPASRIRSTVASVWPLRSRMPFFFAISGNICPGRRKSSGFVSGSTHARAVIPRSSAEIPVVVVLWSIDTVNAVSWLSVLSITICGNCSFRQISALIGIQIKPFACVAMKLTFSVVAKLAAQIRSPSFSRSSSSVTRIKCPCFSSSRAFSTVSNCFIVLLLY